MEQNVELYDGTMVDQKTFRLLFIRMSRRLLEMQKKVEEYSRRKPTQEEVEQLKEALEEFGILKEALLPEHLHDERTISIICSIVANGHGHDMPSTMNYYHKLMKEEAQRAKQMKEEIEDAKFRIELERQQALNTKAAKEIRRMNAQQAQYAAQAAQSEREAADSFNPFLAASFFPDQD